MKDEQDFNLDRVDLQKAIFTIKSKLFKYYFKTKGREGLLYIIADVLNLT